MRYSRIDLSILNAFLALSPLEKINKHSFIKKISKNIGYLDFPNEFNVNKIAQECAVESLKDKNFIIHLLGSKLYHLIPFL